LIFTTVKVVYCGYIPSDIIVNTKAVVMVELFNADDRWLDMMF